MWSAWFCFRGILQIWIILIGYRNLKLYQRLRYWFDRDYRGKSRIFCNGEGCAISISMPAPLMYLQQTCYHFDKTCGFRHIFAGKTSGDFKDNDWKCLMPAMDGIFTMVNTSYFK